MQRGSNPGQLGNCNWGLMTEPPAELETELESQIIANFCICSTQAASIKRHANCAYAPLAHSAVVSPQSDFNQPRPLGQALSDINAGNLALDKLRDKQRRRHLHMSNSRRQ